MDYIKLTEISNKYNLDKDRCYNLLLKYGNMVGIKLLHKINEDIITPKSLFDDMIFIENKIKNRLTSYSEIKEKAKREIPFTGDGHVYYLFQDNDLVYVGQSVNIASRIGEHYRSKKVFNRVYTENVDIKDLLLIEAFYIYRDMPTVNVSVMSNEDYFMTILKRTDINRIFN